MIESMTGYGKGVVSLPTKKITVEIKSLNSKHVDLNMRVPVPYKALEIGFRKKVVASLYRGKIEVIFNVEDTSESASVFLNKGVVEDYIQQLKSISVRDDMTDGEYLKLAIRFPETFKADEVGEMTQEEVEGLHGALDLAIEQVQNFRLVEGKSIQEDFQSRLVFVRQCLENVIQLDPQRIKNVKQKLYETLEKSALKIDENRFEQELVFYLEKLDINEEISRLTSHLNHFETTLKQEERVGKKIGFITQEIGREMNTIGSKANFAALQRVVVLMKNELEKIKEQVLNTL